MNLEDRILEIENQLVRIAKNVRELRGVEAKLSQIAAGTLPGKLTAHFTAYADLEATDTTDEAFITALAEVSGLKEPVAGMMNLATLTARLKAASDRVGERIKKLSDRASAAGSLGEGENANTLKAKLRDTKKILDTRVEATLKRYYEMRLYVINATLKIDTRVCALWPDGSPELRTAALNSSAQQAIASLGEWDKIATQGALKVGSSSGKGGVRI